MRGGSVATSRSSDPRGQFRIFRVDTTNPDHAGCPCLADYPILGVDKEGRTLVPLKMYFNDRGLAKVELGIGRGRKNIDKRDVEKQRDWNRHCRGS